VQKTLRVIILGSTGSVGRQAVDVAKNYPERIQVLALAAHSNLSLLCEQANELGVRDVALATRCSPQPDIPKDLRLGFGTSYIAQLIERDDVDVVLNAIVGVAGLKASFATLKAGKRLALANKESLVVGGDILMPLAAPGQILPVDSEHSALYQCLVGEDVQSVCQLWLTASGGPFRGWDRKQLAAIDATQALTHPTWQMGPKITIDSATLMNKGLEIIEAHHLFAIPYSNICVVVHPQSIIHSLVAFSDGSFKAQLGLPDMRLPIQYALSHPRRWPTPHQKPLDLTTLMSLDFQPPDTETFGCLKLARVAGEQGGTCPTALNAANEFAVAAFLDGKIGFLDIERIVERCLEQHDRKPATSIEQLLDVDNVTREQARRFIRYTV
jgi:1-deoxy-D-xylulose-5-phosphate reductoisomerase